ncbi:hypothetical protein [Carnobacterium maltaromaticum]
MNKIKWQGKSKAQMHSFITSNERRGYTVTNKKKHQKTFYVEMTKMVIFI